MLEMNFFVDAHGVARATFPPPFAALSSWLEQDVQSDIATCDFFLSKVQLIIDKALPEWVGTGNAHTVSITKDKVHILNEFAIPLLECTVSLNDFSTILENWKKFLNSTSDGS